MCKRSRGLVELALANTKSPEDDPKYPKYCPKWFLSALEGPQAGPMKRRCVDNIHSSVVVGKAREDICPTQGIRCETQVRETIPLSIHPHNTQSRQESLPSDPVHPPLLETATIHMDSINLSGVVEEASNTNFNSENTVACNKKQDMLSSAVGGSLQDLMDAEDLFWPDGTRLEITPLKSLTECNAENIGTLEGNILLDGNNNLNVSEDDISPSLNIFHTPGTPTIEQNPSPSGQGQVSNNLQDRASGRRKSNPSKWKAYAAKIALNSGEAHLNQNGKPVRARQMGAGCEEKCKLRCHQRISPQQRQTVFNDFWKLRDHTRQWDFINTHCKVLERKRPKEGDSRRTVSRSYGFRVDAEDVPVCQTMFLKTLDISYSWVQSAAKKLGAGASISPDKRGKHSKRPHTIPEEVVKSVVEHINLIPKVEAHYTRKRSKKQYLECGMTVREMHRLYQDWMEEKDCGTRVASERQYRDIFTSKFNIGIFKPKSDQCDLCTLFKNCTPEQKAPMQERMNTHLGNKDRARELKNADKLEASKNKEVCFAIFDFQKVLITPKGEASIFYYKRKLSVYNFSIYDGGKHEGFCHVWHEGLAKRGANEVASCILSFIEKRSAEGITDFRLFSDNCSGQNRNRFVFAMYAYASAKFGVKITHRFLERGHTQNECDSMHACIERASPQEVYLPEQWYNVMRKAKKTGKPYTVIEMNKDDTHPIFDFHSLVKQQQWAKDLQGKKVPWNKVREVHTDGGCIGEVLLKYNYSQADHVKVSIIKNRRGRPLVLSRYSPPKAYTTNLQIPAAKLADLLSMCNSLTVPSEYHTFYQSLHSNPEGEVELEEDEEPSGETSDRDVGETSGGEVNTDGEDTDRW